MSKNKYITFFKNIKFNKSIDFVYRIFNVIKANVFELYKFNIAIVVIFSLILSYYLILVQIKPFSSPYLKETISDFLAKEAGQNFAIDDVLVSFTSGGLVKLDMQNISSGNLPNAISESLVEIPSISFAFPIYRLLFFNFLPSVLLIEDANFVVNSADDPFSLIHKIKPSSSGTNQSGFIYSLFSSIKHVKLFNISIELNNKKKGSTSFFIPDAKFNIKIKNNIRVSSDVSVEYGGSPNNRKSFDVDAHCDLEKISLDGSCRLFSSNFDLNLLSKVSTQPTILDSIESSSFFGVIFSKSKGVKKVSVNSDSSYFNFKAKGVFSKPLNLRDLKFDLTYDFLSDLLDLKSLEAKILMKKKERDLSVIEKSYYYANLESDLKIFGLNNYSNSDVNLKLSNIDAADIERLWPLFLPRQDIRHWVTSHFSSGVLSSGSLNIKHSKVNGIAKLDKLTSQVNFQDMTLNYSSNFPEIKDMNFKLIFTENSMFADIASASVLRSKISNATVAINDFSNPILDIHAHKVGYAVDSFAHINYKSEEINDKFASIFQNSKSDSNVNIRFSLSEEKLDLNKFHIAIDSKIFNTENDVFTGNISLSTKKSLGSDTFVSHVNLDKAFTHKRNVLGIKKLHDDKLSLNFNLSIEKDLLKLSSLFLKLNSKNTVESSFVYNNRTEKFEKIHLKNYDIDNEYTFNYKYDEGVSEIALDGNVVTLTSIDNNADNKKDKQHPLAFFDKLYLNDFNLKVDIKYLSSSNLFSKDINIELRCESYICRKGLFFSKYSNNKMLTDFVISRSDKNTYKITGGVDNVGYLLELYKISRSVKDGKFSVDINQVVDSQREEVLYNGKIELKDNITIYDNPTIKRLESDSMFLTIKDKIFSNNKTTFSRLKSEFIINPKLSIINVKSLIANNLKIGITSKGYYDYRSGNARFKGAIIPGYIVNNLFGIGNIPIVGNVVSGVLTGSKDSGLFGLNYEYTILSYENEPKFKTFPAKSFVPSSIQSLFD